MVRRLLGVVGLSVAMAGVVAMPASADPSPVTTSIQAGNDHTTVGSATFTRELNTDGTEVLDVKISVPSGMTADMLCLSHTAFTDRVTPATCPDQTNFEQHPALNGATTDEYTVDVGTGYIGQSIFAQLHVNTQGATAFAGWQPGNPFYGNVQIDAAPVQLVPQAPLLGRLMPFGLGALFIAGMGLVGWRWRRRLG